MVNNNWVPFLMQYNLKELRRRQEINNQDIARATKMNTSDEVMRRIQDMQDSIAEAILIKYT
ncbi:MAG: hypothetical protein WC441_04945 [Patescibacteria group bacterium]